MTAEDVIASRHPYTYSSQHNYFIQPSVSAALLERLLAVNGKALETLKTPGGGESLASLARRGAKDQKVAVDVLEQVLAALGAQSEYVQSAH
jgi:hypothetical protein